MSQLQNLLFNYPKSDKEAQSILNEDPSSFIDFDSNNGYSIKIPSEEAPGGYWKCFLKFDPDDNDIVESLCSCPEGDFCPHLAIAARIAFPKNSPPLYSEFKTSLWSRLCSRYYSLSCELEFSKDAIQAVDVNSEHAFLLRPKNEQVSRRLKPIFQTTSNHTLKKKWDCLSKILFFETWQFIFDEDANGLPFSIVAHSSNFVMECHVNTDTFCDVFNPIIDRINSNLCFFPKKTKIISAEICKTSHQLTYLWETEPIPPRITESPYKLLGQLKYISKNTFILSRSETVILNRKDLSHLSEHMRNLLSPFFFFSTEKIPLHYNMFFTKDATLHRIPYLFKPGDLTENGFIIDENLAYLENKGFYPITCAYLPEKSSIRNNYVEHFLDTYGDTIETPGFQVHSQSHDNLLTFSISPARQILFHNETKGREPGHTYIFGKWIFYPNTGFFLNNVEVGHIRDGLIVEPENLTDLIKNNESELRNVQGFFSNKPFPIIKAQLKAKREDSAKRLLINPLFLDENDSVVDAILFKNHIYIENLGFYDIPEHLQEFCTKVSADYIPYAEVNEFLFSQVIQSTLISDDISLKHPQHHSFIVKYWKKTPGYIEIDLDLRTDIGDCPFKEVVGALKKKSYFLFTDAGFLNLKKEPFQFLQSFNFQNYYEYPAKFFCLTITDFLKLDALAPTILHPQAIISDQDLNVFHQLKNFCLPQESDLSCVKHHLRPYQKNGLLWLWFLYKHGLSGVLCDEMGLGKTHQAIALMDLAANYLSKEEKQIAVLIVCPTSVIPHWESVVREYLPHLTSNVFHGTNRIKDPSYNTNIVITSYGTLRQNHSLFFKHGVPDIAVFDELQIAKNKNSQIHKILARIEAHMKLGLTGTPIENNLSEFKNLLDIILPGYIPDTVFKELFLKTSNNTIHQKTELIRITRPFVLRRTKKQVLPELPEKVEASYPCYLSPEQKQLYSRLINREQDTLIKELSHENGKIPYFHVFSVLNQLKQICNHPAVYLKNPTAYKSHQSGKWDLFLQILHEALNENKKIVIFSQYLMMIEIFKLYFNEHNISFASIQGKTRNRKEEIDRFLHDPECKIFVGSLLASGVGINLTAGSTVIMYDRWWNPAKESQALDRVHRIGQQNTVFIYKLITENTIEERIDLLIQRKLDLFQDFIPNEDANVIHMLNKEDLTILLSYKEDSSE